MTKEKRLIMQDRKDLLLGPFHLIVRGYRDSPQYGVLLWGRRRSRTLDIWVYRTLLTLRRNTWR